MLPVIHDEQRQDYGNRVSQATVKVGPWLMFCASFSGLLYRVKRTGKTPAELAQIAFDEGLITTQAAFEVAAREATYLKHRMTDAVAATKEASAAADTKGKASVAADEDGQAGDGALEPGHASEQTAANECIICMDLIVEPCVTLCGHIFCRVRRCVHLDVLLSR